MICQKHALISSLLLAGCPSSGKGDSDFECERPASAPSARGYLGEPGADGCAAEERCQSEPGDGGGTCVAAETGTCVLDGLSGGVGVSKDCGRREVCQIDAGWYGQCADWSGELTFEGALSCDKRATELFDAAPGEVIRFEHTFMPPEDEGLGVNGGSWISDGDGDLGGANVGSGLLAIYAEPIAVAYTHVFEYGADYDWNLFVEQCNLTTYTATYRRISGPILHTDAARAMPLGEGDAVTATLGTYDTDGAGATRHLAHAYAVELEAGEFAIDLQLDGVDETTGGHAALVYAWLEGADGTRLDSYTEGSAYLFEVAEAGTYTLWIDHDFIGVSATLYTLSL